MINSSYVPNTNLKHSSKGKESFVDLFGALQATNEFVDSNIKHLSCNFSTNFDTQKRKANQAIHRNNYKNKWNTCSISTMSLLYPQRHHLITCAKISASCTVHGSTGLLYLQFPGHRFCTRISKDASIAGRMIAHRGLYFSGFVHPQ